MNKPFSDGRTAADFRDSNPPGGTGSRQIPTQQSIPSTPLTAPKKVDLSQLGVIGEQQLVHTALEESVKADPSIKDFLIHEGQPIWVACARGKLRLSEIITGAPEMTGPISKTAIFYFVVVHLMGAVNKDQAVKNNERLQKHMQDKTSYSDSIRLSWGSKVRISLFRHAKNQLGLVGRVTSLLLPPLDRIGIPHEAITAIRAMPRGLILITGPMSSGKTGTAQAILNYRNMTSTGHIMTIEDPIETSLTSDKCLITNKEVGLDVTSFYEGLQDALRQAVDVLLIGEMRDAPTIKTAISAAGSGMLVVATVHGDTCGGALTRMMSMLGDEAPGFWKVLSTSLICVVRQALIPTAEGGGWQVVADALINKGGVPALLASADSSKQLDTFASGPTKADSQWISMNDNIRRLVAAKTITAEAAKRETTDVKNLALI